MKTGLQLRLAQHLTLTPQLQQSIRLLQLSTLELQQEIERAVAENPLLELEPAEFDAGEEVVVRRELLRGDDGLEAVLAGSDAMSWESSEPAGLVDGGEAPESPELSSSPSEADTTASAVDPEASDGAIPGGELAHLEWTTTGAGGDFNADEDEFEDRQTRDKSLTEHLLEQVPLLRLEPEVEAVLRALIYCLNEDGWLEASPEELGATLGLSGAVPPELWDSALAALQDMDPAGVGARDLRECLLLQLRARLHTPSREHAERILLEAFDALARGELGRIRKALGLSEVEMAEARRLLAQLTPRPAAAFADVSAYALVPDVIVRRGKRGWQAELNPAVMPRLSVNSEYARLLSLQKEGRSTPLATQLQEARWLVKNVAQRFETILRVSNEIVQRQQAFFDHGEVAMRPLVLREIADSLGLHESTISRVTTQKYLACPRGTFELKFFFGSHVTTDTGGAASSTAIRAMIKSLINEEDPTQPLTDSRIAEILGEQGIQVARRTVAKYREQLNLAPVSQRRLIVDA